MSLLAKIKKIVREESGVTAIEYGLIAALVAVVAIVAMNALGTSVTKSFNKVSTEINNKVK